MSNLKDELSKQGINHASLATKMAEYINDDKANVTLKKWAFETATKALEEPERMNAAPSMGNSIEGQYNAMDAVKERLQAKAKQLGMAH